MSNTYRRFSLFVLTSSLFAALVVLGIFAATGRWAPVTHAQESAFDQERGDFSPDTTTTPNILLQYASVVSAGNTITISRAPVTGATGTTTYDDISLQFAVSAAGKVTVASGYPKVGASPNLLVGAFKAGTYVGASFPGGNMGFVLTGPGVGQGVTVWNVATASGYNYATTPGNATFWVGPLSNSPIAARLNVAKITSTNWTYGILGTQSDGREGANDTWNTNDILGFSQVGNTITIADFTLSGSDQNTPADQFVYTLK